MKGKYIFNMFLLCLCVWAILVDNVYIPKPKDLIIKPAIFSRYRVKEWGGDVWKYDLLDDELLVYAYDRKGREKLYYIEYKPYFESTLKSIPQGTPIQMRYATSLPKFWKKELYEIRINDIPTLQFSAAQLLIKQREELKITGIMGGIFLVLALLGFLTRPRMK